MAKKAKKEKFASAPVAESVTLRGQQHVVFDPLERAVLGKYEQDFSIIPDRRENLFKTGIPGLDYALGGGLPRGQIVHIWGLEGVGKSTVAQHLIAAAQAQKMKTMAMDLENSITRDCAANIGIDVYAPSLRYINRIPNGEVALDMVEHSVRGNLFNLIVIDSVAGLIPEAVRASSNEDVTMAALARLLGKALPKLNNATVNSDAIIVFINQARANIQPGSRKPYIPVGGHALRFFSNINMFLSNIGPVVAGTSGAGVKNIVGQQVKIDVHKNKIAAPRKQVVCNLVYGYGFRRDLDLVLSAVEAKIVDKKGGWYAYNGETIGQGMFEAAAWAKANPGFLDELEDKLYGTGRTDVPSGVVDSGTEETAAPEEPVAEATE